MCLRELVKKDFVGMCSLYIVAGLKHTANMKYVQS